MVKFKIKEMLEKDENIKTRYALQKVTGWPYRRVDSYYKEKVVKINVEELNLLCKIFKCQIYDLIEYIEDEEKKL